MSHPEVQSGASEVTVENKTTVSAAPSPEVAATQAHTAEQVHKTVAHAPESHAPHPEKAHGHDHTPSASSKPTSKPSKVGSALKEYGKSMVSDAKETFSAKRNKQEITTIVNAATYLPRVAFWGGRKAAAGIMKWGTLGIAPWIYKRKDDLKNWAKGGKETHDAKGAWKKFKAYFSKPGRAVGAGVLAMNPWAAVPAAAVLSLAMIIGAGRDMIKPGGFPKLSPSATAVKVENKAKSKEG